MIYTQKFYPTTVLGKDNKGNQLTVAIALEMLESFLSYIAVIFNVNTEPYGTAVKVAKTIINTLKNCPPKKITKQDFEIFIDVWESAEKQRYPNDKQQIIMNAMFCKIALNLVYKED